ncbi:hypothetical protein OAN62_04600 [Gammaproteobacteria bacterium]|nr:hypothetical protein [Gammaproteobacteria bacterium]
MSKFTKETYVTRNFQKISGKVSLTAHAKMHKINPSYDLPGLDAIDIDLAQYNDNNLIKIEDYLNNIF